MSNLVPVDTIDQRDVEVDLSVSFRLDGAAGRSTQDPATVQLVARLRRRARGIGVRGTVAGSIEVSCCRCTASYTLDVSEAFECVLVERIEGKEAETQLSEEDLVFGSYEEGVVDLSALAREQVLLALPGKPLCREDCRGLCPRCGTDLNDGGCTCVADDIDPRLAALKSLLQ